MTVLVLVVVLVVVLPLLGLVLVSRYHRLPGVPGQPRQLPHRPAAGAVPAPGPRHRVDDAHTASYDAGEVLRRLNAEANERHAAMLQRAQQETPSTTSQGGNR